MVAGPEAQDALGEHLAPLPGQVSRPAKPASERLFREPAYRWAAQPLGQSTPGQPPSEPAADHGFSHQRDESGVWSQEVGQDRACLAARGAEPAVNRDERLLASREHPAPEPPVAPHPTTTTGAVHSQCGPAGLILTQIGLDVVAQGKYDTHTQVHSALWGEPAQVDGQVTGLGRLSYLSPVVPKRRGQPPS